MNKHLTGDHGRWAMCETCNLVFCVAEAHHDSQNERIVKTILVPRFCPSCGIKGHGEFWTDDDDNDQTEGETAFNYRNRTADRNIAEQQVEIRALLDRLQATNQWDLSEEQKTEIAAIWNDLDTRFWLLLYDIRRGNDPIRFTTFHCGECKTPFHYAHQGEHTGTPTFCPVCGTRGYGWPGWNDDTPDPDEDDGGDDDKR